MGITIGLVIIAIIALIKLLYWIFFEQKTETEKAGAAESDEVDIEGYTAESIKAKMDLFELKKQRASKTLITVREDLLNKLEGGNEDVEDAIYDLLVKSNTPELGEEYRKILFLNADKIIAKDKEINSYLKNKELQYKKILFQDTKVEDIRKGLAVDTLLRPQILNVSDPSETAYAIYAVMEDSKIKSEKTKTAFKFIYSILSYAQNPPRSPEYIGAIKDAYIANAIKMDNVDEFFKMITEDLENRSKGIVSQELDLRLLNEVSGGAGASKRPSPQAKSSQQAKPTQAKSQAKPPQAKPPQAKPSPQAINEPLPIDEQTEYPKNSELGERNSSEYVFVSFKNLNFNKAKTRKESEEKPVILRLGTKVNNTTKIANVDEYLEKNGFEKDRLYIHEIIKKLNYYSLVYGIVFALCRQEIGILQSIDAECINRFGSKITELQKKIEQLSNLKKEASKIQELEEENEQIKKSLETAEKKLKDYTEEYDESQAQVESLKREIELLEKEKNDCKLKLKNHADVEPLQKEIDSLTKQLKTEDGLYKEILKENEELKLNYKKEKKELQDSYDNLLKKKKEATEELESLEKTLASREEVIRKYEDQIADFKSLEKQMNFTLDKARQNFNDIHSTTMKLGKRNTDLQIIQERLDGMILKLKQTTQAKQLELLKIIRKQSESSAALVKIGEKIQEIKKSIMAKNAKASELNSGMVAEKNAENDRLKQTLKNLEISYEGFKRGLGKFLEVNGYGFAYMEAEIADITREQEEALSSVEALGEKAIDIPKRVMVMAKLEELNRRIVLQENIVNRYNAIVAAYGQEPLTFTLPKKSNLLMKEYDQLLRTYGKHQRDEGMMSILLAKNKTMTNEIYDLKSLVNEISSNYSEREIKEKINKLVEDISKVNNSNIDVEESRIKIEKANSTISDLIQEKANLSSEIEKINQEWKTKLDNCINALETDLDDDLNEMLTVMNISSEVDTNNAPHSNIRKKQKIILQAIKSMIAKLEEAKSVKESLEKTADDLKEAKLNHSKQMAINAELRQRLGETVETLEPIKTVTELLEEENKKLEQANRDLAIDISETKQKLLAECSQLKDQDEEVMTRVLELIQNLDDESYVLDNYLLKFISPAGTKAAYIIQLIKNINPVKLRSKMNQTINALKMSGAAEEEYEYPNMDDEPDEFDEKVKPAEEAKPVVTKRMVEEFKESVTSKTKELMPQIVEAYVRLLYHQEGLNEENVIKLLGMLSEEELKKLYPDEFMTNITKMMADKTGDSSDLIHPFVRVSQKIIEAKIASEEFVGDLSTISEMKTIDFLIASVYAAFIDHRERLRIAKMATAKMRRVQDTLSECIANISDHIKKNSFFRSKIDRLLGISGSTPEDIIKALENKLGNSSVLDRYRESFKLFDTDVKKAISSLDKSIDTVRKVNAQKIKDAEVISLCQQKLKQLTQTTESMAEAVQKTIEKNSQSENLLEEIMKTENKFNEEQAKKAAEIDRLEKEIALLTADKDKMAEELTKALKDLEIQKELEPQRLGIEGEKERLEQLVADLKSTLFSRLAKTDDVDPDNVNEILARLDEEKRASMESLRAEMKKIVDLATQNNSQESGALVELVAVRAKEIINMLPRPEQLATIFEIMTDVSKKWEQNKIDMRKYVTLNQALEAKVVELSKELSSAKDEVDALRKTQADMDAYKLIYSLMTDKPELLEKVLKSPQEIDTQRAYMKDLVEKFKTVEKELPEIEQIISQKMTPKLRNAMYLKDKEINRLKKIIDEKINENKSLIDTSEEMAKNGTLSVLTLSELSKTFAKYREDLIRISLAAGELISGVDKLHITVGELKKIKSVNETERLQLQLALAKAEAEILLNKETSSANILEAIKVIKKANDSINELAEITGKMSAAKKITKIESLKQSVKKSLNDEVQAMIMRIVTNDAERAKIISEIKKITIQCPTNTVYEEVYYPVYVDKST